MITDKERQILEHSTGWKSKNPLYRNHFATESGTDDWDTVQELCGRGLMKLTHGPDDLYGGLSFFHVTEKGIALLRSKCDDMHKTQQ